MIKKFRKLPVEIEAVVYDGTNDAEVVNFAMPNVVYNSEPKRIGILTLEGEMEVSVGDYVIKGVKGEFYPCKPDVFKSSYEEVL